MSTSTMIDLALDPEALARFLAAPGALSPEEPEPVEPMPEEPIVFVVPA